MNEDFEKWASGFDHESREWLDMGNDKVFAAGYESRQPEIDALKAENERLRMVAEEYVAKKLRAALEGK